MRLNEFNSEWEGKGVTVHASAYVDDGAKIGLCSKIWHFSHVNKGAVIGRECMVGQNCYIADVKIGDRVRIQNNVSVYNGVELEDDVFVGPSVVFTNDFIPPKNVFKKTVVRKGATIGANATVVCGIEIGEGAFIGADSVVTHDVPAGEKWFGNPARKR